HRRGLPGKLERLPRVDDTRTLLRVLHLQDGYVTIHVVAHVEVLAVGAPHHPLGQPAHLDLVEPGHLLAVDLEDDHAAVAVVVPGIPRLVAPPQKHDGGEIALGADGEPFGRVPPHAAIHHPPHLPLTLHHSLL